MSEPTTDTPTAGPSEFTREVDVDLTPVLSELLAGRTLSAEQTAEAFEAMMTGQVHHGEMGALLALLATRTPTPEEILGAARVIRMVVTDHEDVHRGDTITAQCGGHHGVPHPAAILPARAGIEDQHMTRRSKRRREPLADVEHAQLDGALRQAGGGWHQQRRHPQGPQQAQTVRKR